MPYKQQPRRPETAVSWLRMLVEFLVLVFFVVMLVLVFRELNKSRKEAMTYRAGYFAAMDRINCLYHHPRHPRYACLSNKEK